MSMGEENIKDTVKDIAPAPISSSSRGIQVGSYGKADKLITALYMVTDIMDRDEPIRAKLRSLGTAILSDAYAFSSVYRTSGLSRSSAVSETESRIMELLSFLDIASSVGLISEMNAGILKREFMELDRALREYIDQEYLSADSGWLEKLVAKGHDVTQPVPILKKKEEPKKVEMSDRAPAASPLKDTFDALKKERRDAIIAVIKGFSEGATISDIRSKAQGALASCGEKTLQRELVSMTADGLLKRHGEKRWSRYSINN